MQAQVIIMKDEFIRNIKQKMGGMRQMEKRDDIVRPPRMVQNYYGPKTKKSNLLLLDHGQFEYTKS